MNVRYNVQNKRVFYVYTNTNRFYIFKRILSDDLDSNDELKNTPAFICSASKQATFVLLLFHLILDSEKRRNEDEQQFLPHLLCTVWSECVYMSAAGYAVV